MTSPSDNPPLDQDRAFDLWDTWQKHGCVMFRQQLRIYEQIAERIAGKSVLEVGCGNGVGSAVLEREARRLVMTDKVKGNVDFAQALYPWIRTAVVDVSSFKAVDWKVEVVVAVEVLEHVADPIQALRNMLDWATEEVWISTPNGKGRPRPPSNPHHVREYAQMEMLDMVVAAADRNGTYYKKVECLDWETFSLVGFVTDADPLVYRIVK